MWQGSIKGIKPANIPSIIVPDTRPEERRHGTAWDCDQYQGPRLWHKSFYLMTPSLSWHNVTQCVTLSRMLSRGGEWVRISLILCMIVEGHIQNRSYNCITIATLRHLHDLNISHLSHFPEHVATSFHFQFCWILWPGYIYPLWWNDDAYVWRRYILEARQCYPFDASQLG